MRPFFLETFNFESKTESEKVLMRSRSLQVRTCKSCSVLATSFPPKLEHNAHQVMDSDDDEIQFIGYGVQNKKISESNRSTSQRKKVSNGMKSSSSTKLKQTKLLSDPITSSNSSERRSSTSMLTSKKPVVDLSGEDSFLEDMEVSANIGKGKERQKDSDKATRLRGGTGRHGVQLDTVTPILPEERFWNGGVKVSLRRLGQKDQGLRPRLSVSL